LVGVVGVVDDEYHWDRPGHGDKVAGQLLDAVVTAMPSDVRGTLLVPFCPGPEASD
jgi:hypothetical protein